VKASKQALWENKEVFTTKWNKNLFHRVEQKEGIVKANVGATYLIAPANLT